METFLSSLLAFFVIVDPIGVSLVFNALTDGEDDAYCRKMAIRSVVISTTLVLIFGFWGAGFLKIMGIQMEAFKITGGILIFYAAFGMITKADEKPGAKKIKNLDDISVFPLSIPMIAGPGCLTLTVLQFSAVAKSGDSHIPLVAAIIAVYTMTLLSFLFSRQLVKLVGKTLNNIFKRLLGVLLAALAIQFIVDGIKGVMG